MFGRYYSTVESLKASFTVQLPANRTYDVLFWADCVDDATSGLSVDKYYTTNSDDGLKNVSILGTYAGNNDARDAFFYYESCTIEQGGTTKNFTLKRPFSQINVYTTDVKYFKTATDAIPAEVNVTLKKPYTAINVMTGELSGNSSDLTYTASLYDFPDYTQCDLTTVDKAKLSMDYIFGAEEQGAIDIEWQALKESNSPVVHDFTSIPYKRNYRTNIKGDLLTSVGSWTVTVSPAWGGDDYEKVVVSTTVDDIEEMNDFIAANPNADQYNVSFSDDPNDGGTPGEDVGAHAMLTTGLAEGNVLNVAVESELKTLYIGDYVDQNTITSVVTQGVHAAKVNINVPSGNKIKKLIINAPSKSVYLNGELITSCGTLDDVEAITSNNTLVVEKNQTIGKLTVRKGGLEIHGTVTTLVISPDNGAEVKVRTSENLSAEVFAVIKGNDHDYIDRPKYCEKQNGELWDIVSAECVIGTEADPTKGFASLEEAFTAAETDQTITLLTDVELEAEILVNKNITLDLNGYSINSNTVSAFQVNNGKLDITGEGKIYGTPANYKEIYLKGSTESSASDYSVLSIGQNAKVSCENGYAVMVSANSECAYGVKITVDGQVEGYYGALYVNGSVNKTEGNVPEITVNGTLVTNEESAAVYAAGYAKYIYNSGATVTGGDALYICGGETVINGGAFIGNGAKAAYTPQSSGYEQTGDAVVVDKKEGYPAMSVSVKGGSFKSVNADAIASYSNVESGELKNILGGGVYSTKPAANLAKEFYYIVDNQDALTKADYPWTVTLSPLPGGGTQADPYQVASASDLKVLRIMMEETPEETMYFALTANITLTEDDAVSGYLPRIERNVDAMIPIFKNGVFDGAGHTLTVDNVVEKYVFGETQDCTIKNLKVSFNSAEDAAVVYCGKSNSNMEDVEVLGDIMWNSGNAGAFYNYICTPVSLDGCINRAVLQSKTGDKTMYDGIFFGYALAEQGTVSLTDCFNEGSLKAGKAGFVIGNGSYSARFDFVLTNCKNNGEVRSLYSPNSEWNYLAGYVGIGDKAHIYTFKFGDVKYTSSTTPKWYELDAQGEVVGTGSFILGPNDPDLALTLNEDKTFTVTPATTATPAYHVVSVGIYAGTASGSTRVYATEQITGTITTLKHLYFVDDEWLTANLSAVQGSLAGNVIYTLGDDSYYYVGSGHSLGGQPQAPEMVSVTAYDANDVMIASAPLSAN